MPWKYNDRVIKEGRSWTNDDGIQHPRNWSIWSDEDKTANGLVWEDEPAFFDNRFWWSANNPKALDDVNEVDAEGNPILDMNGEQLVTIGLKSQWKKIVKEQAGGKLQSTDWMVIKATEVADYTVPTDITTYRAAVRTASNTIEASINNAADHTAFVALFDTPMVDGVPTGNAPINDWPEEI